MCTHNLNLEGAPHILLELATGLPNRGIIAPIVHSFVRPGMIFSS